MSRPGVRTLDTLLPKSVQGKLKIFCSWYVNLTLILNDWIIYFLISHSWLDNHWLFSLHTNWLTSWWWSLQPVIRWTNQDRLAGDQDRSSRVSSHNRWSSRSSRQTTQIQLEAGTLTATVNIASSPNCSLAWAMSSLESVPSRPRRFLAWLTNIKCKKSVN